MEEVVIVAAKRTAIGSFGGVFKKVSAVDLGVTVVNQLLQDTGVAGEDVNEVVFGNVLSAGLGQNVARQIAVKSGLPVEVPAHTINMVCGSGLKVFEAASLKIATGMADCIIVGGTENMSQAPYLQKNQRWGTKMGPVTSEDAILVDGLTDAYSGQHMGITAENIAEKYNISREEQDDFALDSQINAEVAMNEGRFRDEIVPVPVKHPRTRMDVEVVNDEYPRPGMVMAKLKNLKPAFKPDGTVTAGNASGINDGAAAVILMSRRKAESMGLEVLAKVRNYAEAGLDPDYMGEGPIPATRKILQQSGLSIADIDLFEINEAFASQSIRVLRELELPAGRVNVNGGAIALGHPIGASGTRIVVTLLHEMLRRDSKLGLASLCIGGGMGASLIIERE